MSTFRIKFNNLYPKCCQQSLTTSKLLTLFIAEIGAAGMIDVKLDVDFDRYTLSFTSILTVGIKSLVEYRIGYVIWTARRCSCRVII